MRLRARLTGSRFGRGVIVPGGVRVDGRDRARRAARGARRARARPDARPAPVPRHGFDDRPADRHRARCRATLVEEYGAVGPLARGSGLSTDARHERPYGDYRRLGLQVVTRRER